MYFLLPSISVNFESRFRIFLRARSCLCEACLARNGLDPRQTMEKRDPSLADAGCLRDFIRSSDIVSAIVIPAMLPWSLHLCSETTMGCMLPARDHWQNAAPAIAAQSAGSCSPLRGAAPARFFRSTGRICSAESSAVSVTPFYFHCLGLYLR